MILIYRLEVGSSLARGQYRVYPSLFLRIPVSKNMQIRIRSDGVILPDPNFLLQYSGRFVDLHLLGSRSDQIRLDF